MSIKKPLPVAIPVRIAAPHSVVDANAMLDSVQRGIRGIQDRIKGLDLPTTPAAYIGPTPAFVFAPEAQSFPFDVAQANGAGGFAATYPVNYIVKSGITYQLPVVVGGNGLFLCTRFRINMWQRLVVNESGAKNIAQGALSPISNFFWPNGVTPGVAWTSKFSCWPNQPASTSPQGTQVVSQAPCINFRWNIQDPVTGYNYSDQLIPASAILNRQYINVAEAQSGTPILLNDGDWHEFDVPWRFEKAYLLNVAFRPVTDVIQVDSSIAGTAAPMSLNYDDRIGGLRDESVYVQCEFQGERVGGT